MLAVSLRTLTPAGTRRTTSPMATMTLNWEDMESNTALVRSSFTSPKTVFTRVLARTRQPSPRFASPKIATMFSLLGPAPAESTKARG